MPIDEFIIKIYLMVDDYYKKIVTNRLRQGGYVPKLTDSEIITMELVGEFLQMDTDSQIHQYFKTALANMVSTNRLISKLCQAMRQFVTSKNFDTTAYR